MLSVRLLCALLFLLATFADADVTRLPRVDGTSSQNLSPSTAYLRRSTRTGELIPVPTAEILAWQAREISVLIHFNLATFLDATKYDGCNGNLNTVPDVAIFQPFQLNTDQWVQSMEALGAKGAVLVVKHNCGFTIWPTSVTFNTKEGVQHVYNYSIQYSPVADMDVAGSFVQSCQKAGIATGFYYSVVSNNWMNVGNGIVQNGSIPLQVNVTQQSYEQVVYEQVAELWSLYGSLGEIWFDGGILAEWRNTLAQLLTKYQPAAAIFNGCVDENGPTDNCVRPTSVRWIGTEDGTAPDPNWSTGVTNDGGQANATLFCPAECDTTLQENDRWFWGANQQLRPLAELVDVYHNTVGHNCLLQMDLTPDTDGLIPATYAARYAQLGGVIRSCYVDQVIQPDTSECDDDGACELTFDTPVSVDRIVLMEDQTQGQVIRGYTVDALIVGNYTAAGVAEGWQQLSVGSSVGHKKIDVFGAPVTVSAVRVNVTDMADTPVWSSIRLQLCDQIVARAIQQSEQLEEEERKGRVVADGAAVAQ